MSIITTHTLRSASLFEGHRLAGLLRAQLAAVLLAILAGAVAPQAMAQTCGPNITLTQDEWTMVGIPCVPGAANTIGDVFGPSLDAADYAVTWIAWKRVYDDAVNCPSASPADCYIKLTVADTVSAGDSFWIFTTVPATLDFSTIGATATPGPDFPVDARPSPTIGVIRYYMLADPYAGTVNGNDFIFSGLLFGFLPLNLSANQAVNLAIVGPQVHYWNGNTYLTKTINVSPPDVAAATFEPKEAAWIEMLQTGVIFSELKIRVPEPP